jgi:dolichol-phosphate mannosyltransferase
LSSLDVVIPVYNESDSIVAVLEALRSNVHANFSVYVCYDRDDDSTLTALQEFRPQGFSLTLVKNIGSGPHSAVLAGFTAGHAPAVVVFPADDTTNARILDAMLQKWAEGAAVVAASRFMPGGCMVGCRWQKAVLVRLAAYSMHHVARVGTHDATNGFRLFSRQLLDQVQIESSAGFTYSIELLVKAHRLGLPIEEVPAQWVERSHGKSRFRIGKWLLAYSRWYFYAFGTTYLRRGPETVRRQVTT